MQPDRLGTQWYSGGYCCVPRQPGNHSRLCRGRRCSSPFPVGRVQSRLAVYSPLRRLFTHPVALHGSWESCMEVVNCTAGPAPPPPLERPLLRRESLQCQWPMDSLLAGLQCYLQAVRGQRCHSTIPKLAIMAYRWHWKRLMAPCPTFVWVVEAYHSCWGPQDFALRLYPILYTGNTHSYL